MAILLPTAQAAGTVAVKTAHDEPFWEQITWWELIAELADRSPLLFVICFAIAAYAAIKILGDFKGKGIVARLLPKNSNSFGYERRRDDGITNKEIMAKLTAVEGQLTELNDEVRKLERALEAHEASNNVQFDKVSTRIDDLYKSLGGKK